MDKEIMHVCYAINNGYTDYCMVSMVSILETNKSPISFHILTDSLNDYNIKKLTSLAERYQQQIYIYNVDDKKLEGQKTTWTKYGWYRIFAPELLPQHIDKVLYLDCDTIVCQSISELFEIDYDSHSVAGVTDLMDIFPSIYEQIGYEMDKGYFCSGVLMMNLDYFRKHNLSDKILQFALQNPSRINFPDQDALNYICRDSKITLPLKYGILEPFFRHKEFISKYKTEVAEALESPRIIHYAGCAPWIIENRKHFFDSYFWKYANKIGGIERKHFATGMTLFKHRIKVLLGLIGFKKYSGLSHRKPLKRSEILNLINSHDS